MTALFLGAGFSKWSAGLPLANEIFDFAVEPWGPRDQGRLDTVRGLKQRWDQANPVSTSEEFIAHSLRLPGRQKQAVLWYVGRRLSEPFTYEVSRRGRHRRVTYMVDELLKRGHDGVRVARSFLSPFLGRRVSGIVTVNYDMLVEYSLGSGIFNYGTRGEVLAGSGFPRLAWRDYPVTLRGRIPLAKVHGSLSWDDERSYLDGRRGLTGRALIVAPTPEKAPPSALKPTWDLADRILRQTDRLLVFGFAFNPYDEAVLTLLRSSGAAIRSVLLVDVDPKLARAAQLWPAAEVAAAPPPPDGSGVISAWRDSA